MPRARGQPERISQRVFIRERGRAHFDGAAEIVIFIFRPLSGRTLDIFERPGRRVPRLFIYDPFPVRMFGMRDDVSPSVRRAFGARKDGLALRGEHAPGLVAVSVVCHRFLRAGRERAGKDLTFIVDDVTARRGSFARLSVYGERPAGCVPAARVDERLFAAAVSHGRTEQLRGIVCLVRNVPADTRGCGDDVRARQIVRPEHALARPGRSVFLRSAQIRARDGQTSAVLAAVGERVPRSRPVRQIFGHGSPARFCGDGVRHALCGAGGYTYIAEFRPARPAGQEKQQTVFARERRVDTRGKYLSAVEAEIGVQRGRLRVSRNSERCDRALLAPRYVRYPHFRRDDQPFARRYVRRKLVRLEYRDGRRREIDRTALRAVHRHFLSAFPEHRQIGVIPIGGHETHARRVVRVLVVRDEFPVIRESVYLRFIRRGPAVSVSCHAGIPPRILRAYAAYIPNGMRPSAVNGEKSARRPPFGISERQRGLVQSARRNEHTVRIRILRDTAVGVLYLGHVRARQTYLDRFAVRAKDGYARSRTLYLRRSSLAVRDGDEPVAFITELRRDRDVSFLVRYFGQTMISAVERKHERRAFIVRYAQTIGFFIHQQSRSAPIAIDFPSAERPGRRERMPREVLVHIYIRIPEPVYVSFRVQLPAAQPGKAICLSSSAVVVYQRKRKRQPRAGQREQPFFENEMPVVQIKRGVARARTEIFESAVSARFVIARHALVYRYLLRRRYSFVGYGHPGIAEREHLFIHGIVLRLPYRAVRVFDIYHHPFFVESLAVPICRTRGRLGHDQPHCPCFLVFYHDATGGRELVRIGRSAHGREQEPRVARRRVYLA